MEIPGGRELLLSCLILFCEETSLLHCEVFSVHLHL